MENGNGNWNRRRDLAKSKAEYYVKVKYAFAKPGTAVDKMLRLLRLRCSGCDARASRSKLFDVYVEEAVTTARGVLGIRY
jgi:hypothetical protein